MRQTTRVAAAAATIATLTITGAGTAHAATTPYQKTLHKQTFTTNGATNTLTIVRTSGGAHQAILVAPKGTGRNKLSALKLSYHCNTSIWAARDLRGTAKWNQNQKGAVRNRLVLTIPQVKPGCDVTASVTRGASLNNPRGHWAYAKKVHVSQNGKVTATR